MLLNVPRENPHMFQLIRDMVGLSQAIKQYRAQLAMRCETCVFGRVPTPHVLDNRPEYIKPENVGNRLICLRGLEADPIVAGYRDGEIDSIILVHPNFCCVLYEAKR
jgi:hypothetical protein